MWTGKDGRPSVLWPDSSGLGIKLLAERSCLVQCHPRAVCLPSEAHRTGSLKVYGDHSCLVAMTAVRKMILPLSLVQRVTYPRPAGPVVLSPMQKLWNPVMCPDWPALMWTQFTNIAARRTFVVEAARTAIKRHCKYCECPANSISAPWRDTSNSSLLSKLVEGALFTLQSL